MTVGNVDVAIRVSRHGIGVEAGRLSGDGGEGFAAILRDIQAYGWVRNTDEGSLGEAVVGGAAALDEVAEDDTDAGVSRGAGGATDGKAGNGLPVMAVIKAAIDAVQPREEVDVRAIVRVDKQALAGEAASVVGAELDGQRNDVEVAALVRRDKDGAVAFEGLGIGAGGKVEALRIVRIEPDGLGADVVELRVVEEVSQRRPGLGGWLPAIGAADVGAGIADIAVGGLADNAGDEAAGNNLDIFVVEGDNAGRALCERGARGEKGGRGRVSRSGEACWKAAKGSRVLVEAGRWSKGERT